MVFSAMQDQPLDKTTKETIKPLWWFCWKPQKNGWYVEWYGYMFSNNVARICTCVTIGFMHKKNNLFKTSAKYKGYIGCKIDINKRF